MVSLSLTLPIRNSSDRFSESQELNPPSRSNTVIVFEMCVMSASVRTIGVPC